MIRRFLDDVLRMVGGRSSSKGSVFSDMPDNPWTYPGCGVHVKASDFFSGGHPSTVPDPSAALTQQEAES